MTESRIWVVPLYALLLVGLVWGGVSCSKDRKKDDESSSEVGSAKPDPTGEDASLGDLEKVDPLPIVTNEPPGDSPKLDSSPIVIKATHNAIFVDGKSVAKMSCRKGDSPCSQQDLARRRECKQPDASCDAAELEEIKNMVFYVDDLFKEEVMGQKSMIISLREELRKIVKQRGYEDEAMGIDFETEALLVAEKDLPHRVVMEMMAAATAAGITSISLAFETRGQP